ncbi:WD40 repeat-like-containing domain protein [Moelleriella libera RCEF 2490]|uniref:WD40 repeat-like-containing domain protein n=1 Tax=Moelleriella libera RCEF 2490 TaxID=1081109 RepID=A0A167WSH1_9HYPO|nr:WD40 repeat-like-containing domain protein [Moelleriella libera RCEF 2490]
MNNPHRFYGFNSEDSIPRWPSSATAQSLASTRRSSSNASSASYPTYTMHPAPDKPLPPLPTSASGSSTSIGRPLSHTSLDSSFRSSHYSDRSASFGAQPSGASSTHSSPPSQFAIASKQQYAYNVPQSSLSTELSLRTFVVSDDKRINNSVHYLDISSTSCTLASKHGNNVVKVWSVDTGDVLGQIKFSSYTEARSRSRDYLIRSHAILSEINSLIAIATKFGRTLEIWNWERRRCLQTIDGTDRWAVGKMETYDHGWASLAVYRGETGIIDLFAATKEKKPFIKARTISLTDANLPFVPQYPELALSATSPLLIAVAGPRPPRRGHPPPQRETLLVAWQTHHDATSGSRPYRIARPWQHRELDTAIPSDLNTYGSIVVSIWIPATYRAVPAPATRGGTCFNLHPVEVTSRYVLVWDLAANSTRTFGIPNCTACISPDCRFVAYCHASGAAIGARGTLAVLDVISSREIWCWPDRNATAIDSGPQPGFSQFDDLAKVNELSFSADSKSLMVGDGDGRICIYDISPRDIV